MALLLACGVLIFPGLAATEFSADSLLQAWLAASTNLSSFQANLIQTRHLKALTQPLTSTGKVWFAAPNYFRWELGSPPQSIALRSGETLLILSPRMRRAESYPLGGAASGPAKDLMGLLDAAFPRSLDEFKKQFEVTGVSTHEEVLELKMVPRSPMGRKMMPSLTVELVAGSFQLRSTEMTFADGSRLRNEFSGMITNQPISEDLFRTNLDASWKTTRGGISP